METSWRRNYLRYKSYFLNVSMHYKQRADLKAYLEILLSLATISIFAFFALKPTLTTISQLTKEIKSKKDTLVQMNDKINNLSRAQALYDQQRESIGLLAKALPDTPELGEVSRQIEGATAKSSIAMESLTIGKINVVGAEQDQDKEKAGNTTYVLSAPGEITSYKDLSTLFKDFVNLRRVNKIDSITLGVSNKSNQETKLLLYVNGNFLYYTPMTDQEETK